MNVSKNDLEEAKENVIYDITSYLESMLQTGTYDDLETEIVREIIESHCLEKTIDKAARLR